MPITAISCHRHRTGLSQQEGELVINSSFSVSGSAAAAAPRPTAPTAGVTDRWNGKANNLANLTAADRSLITDALGVDLNADGVDPKGHALAPMLVHIMAIDRAQGRLPASQPISAGYLHNLISENSGSSDFANLKAGVDKLIDALGRQSPTTRSEPAAAGPVLTSAWSAGRRSSDAV
ncbi:hypothetical protein [Modestobacter sp. SYSU DS0875]